MWRNRVTLIAVLITALMVCAGQVAATCPDVTVRMSAAPEQSDVLRQINLKNACHLSARAISDLQRRLGGRKITPSTMKEVSRAMQKAYARQGYDFVAVIIPPQQVVQGVVQLKVLEGKISKINYLGRQAAPRRQAAALFGPIKDRQPVSDSDLDWAYQVSNRVPGLEVRTALGPDNTEGAMSLLIEAEQTPSRAFLSVTNNYGAALGRWGVTAGVQRYGGSLYGDELDAQILASPDGYRLRSGGFSYMRGLNALGTQVALTVSATKAKPLTTLQDFSVVTDAVSARAEISQPLALSFENRVVGSLGFEISNQTSNNFGATALRFGTPVLSRDRIRILNAKLTGQFEFSKLTGDWNLEVRKGIDKFGASRIGDMTLSRGQGDPDALIYKGGFRVETAAIPLVVVEVRGLFQNTDHRALLSEQFSVGPATIGRGYDTGAVQGDRAWAGGVELRSHAMPAPKIGAITSKFSAFAFTEAASLKYNFASTPARWASSSGAGVRWELGPAWQASLTYADPRQTGGYKPPKLTMFTLASNDLGSLKQPFNTLFSMVRGGGRR